MRFTQLKAHSFVQLCTNLRPRRAPPRFPDNSSAAAAAVVVPEIIFVAPPSLLWKLIRFAARDA